MSTTPDPTPTTDEQQLQRDLMQALGGHQREQQLAAKLRKYHQQFALIAVLLAETLQDDPEPNRLAEQAMAEVKAMNPDAPLSEMGAAASRGGVAIGQYLLTHDNETVRDMAAAWMTAGMAFGKFLVEASR